MTRGLILAILTFALLIIANLAVFGFLSFGVLSETLVREKLVNGLHEAERLMQEELGLDPLDGETAGLALSRQIAPRLRKFSFFVSVVILDRNGRVLHREKIRGDVVVGTNQNPPRPHPENKLGPSMIPVGTQSTNLPSDQQLALEYHPGLIEQEVATLRRDLNRKLTIAIVLSVVLLGLGLAYVIWAYRRNRELQEQATKADQMAYVGTLASGLAHEIRNPLNSMNMNVQLIQEELEERSVHDMEDLSDMLGATRKEIMRLERLVSSFLSYARPGDIELRPCSVNDLIQAVLQFLEPEIRKSGIVLKTNFDADLAKIPMDEAQMRQALLNIIQNSVQILKPGKVLEISTQAASGDKVHIKVSDNGPGISEPELKNIFKVFYSTRIGGTGLGLPIALRIAERHQGRIDVESRVGVGTTFTIALPKEAVAA
ncbi:Histidine kinase domain-containing protein [Acanthopleuribacter pedis]